MNYFEKNKESKDSNLEYSFKKEFLKKCDLKKKKTRQSDKIKQTVTEVL